MRYVTPRPASAGKTGRAARFRSKPLLAVLGLLLITAASAAYAQSDVFKPPPPVTYTEKFEVYGGLSFMNGQAGQNLAKRYNMAGGEGMFTWWITPKIGAAGDYRWEGGTTPVDPAAQVHGIQTRPFVTQNVFMGGVTYRGPRNQHAALTFHALAGGSAGNFTHSTNGLDPTQYAGMYQNHTAPVGAIGGSLDFNRSARLAIRLSPDMIFEHFGTETREFFSISGGIVYRFGHR